MYNSAKNIRESLKEEKQLFYRICPLCNRELLYRSKKRFEVSSALNRPCQPCINKHNLKDKFKDIRGDFEKECPRCSCKMKYTTKNLLFTAKYFNLLCFNCIRNKNCVELYQRIYDVQEIENGEKYERTCPDCNVIITYPTFTSAIRGAKGNAKCRTCKDHSKSGGVSFWQGMFFDIRFKSLFELSFLSMQNEITKIESGEQVKYRIPYEIESKKHYYYPDFVINGKNIIECKFTKALSDKVVQCKKDTAIIWCNKNNFTYDIVTEKDVKHYNLKAKRDLTLLLDFVKDEKLIFSNTTIEKFNKKLKAAGMKQLKNQGKL